MDTTAFLCSQYGRGGSYFKIFLKIFMKKRVFNFSPNSVIGIFWGFSQACHFSILSNRNCKYFFYPLPFCNVCILIDVWWWLGDLWKKCHIFSYYHCIIVILSCYLFNIKAIYNVNWNLVAILGVRHFKCTTCANSLKAYKILQYRNYLPSLFCRGRKWGIE